ncbi:type II toxin-antitoxin system YoeB family toxin [Sphingomonas sp.]|jgi:Txe/YoeB family toxin of toxin-antitoxin system|uniref:type II toxin-antitoxin system YoeB family toxin n=1 Tax=Sphingomonas sp. TaxID=28214 RepID=UPI002D7ED7EA|nr:type II toxin-antitoxin system YoeB family toxin [Sphingomonas sp.]HEU0045318.1 type II toxin-antitoxin system YoeB family toxin [Sphingomonas sp.]
MCSGICEVLSNGLVAECEGRKPQPLEGNLKDWWPRRITSEHRLMYQVTGKGEAQALEVAQCRYHY